MPNFLNNFKDLFSSLMNNNCIFSTKTQINRNQTAQIYQPKISTKNEKK